ncbi:hypothetical protein BKA69DRAFT_1076460 [Paraphysoderma sedebokerense]|nr:hypothetical protein BKA69DRAFT_1076460 [Paraphysoderma sedebokerense]
MEDSIHPSIWSGFYKKALKERQNQLKLAFPNLFPSTTNGNSPVTSPSGSPSLGPLNDSKYSSLNSGYSATQKINNGTTISQLDEFPIKGLDERIADNMVENCIGTIGLPVGLALNFTIDSKPVVIPMAVEEPSVIAAVSGAAKTICGASASGFSVSVSERNVVIAQIQLLDIPDTKLTEVEQTLLSMKSEIIDFANQYCQSMKSRGGGVIDVELRRVTRNVNPYTKLSMNSKYMSHFTSVRHTPSFPTWFVAHIYIDVCDAMGANCASTVAEGTAPFLQDLTGCRIGLKIVSNLNTHRISKASFRIPVSALEYKSHTGVSVASRILEAFEWANDDPYRCTTHNKGIMNGIDAVALATGQDWRAIEAAVHSWAAGSGQNRKWGYQSLTKYWVEDDVHDQLWFCAELELPIAVGTKGGVLNTNPVYQYTLGLMGHPNSQRLASIMCCVGLAQNFAALRALATEGIQRGHMHLHARNIAIAAGSPTHAIPEVTAWMIEKGRISFDAAKEYIVAHHLYTNIRKRLNGSETANSSSLPKPPSMFYFQERLPSGSKEKPFSINIAFQTLGPKPVFLDFTESPDSNPVYAVLFGNKTHEWLMQLFPLLDSIRLMPSSAPPSPANELLCKKLKIFSLLLNILTRRLMLWCPEETRAFVNKIFSHTKSGAKAFKNISETRKSKGYTSRSQTGGKKPSIARFLQTLAKHTENLMPVIKDDTHGTQENSTGREEEDLSIVTSLFPNLSKKSPLSVSLDLSADLSPISISPLNLSLNSSGSSFSASPVDNDTSSIEWTLPDIGIFRSSLLDDEFDLSDEYTPGPPSNSSTKDNVKPSNPKSDSYAPNLSQSNLRHSITLTELNVPSKKQILQVGFPLLLSIWQIFEVWVAQSVGHRTLASALLEEQRIIVSTLVATSNDILSVSNRFSSSPTDNQSYTSEDFAFLLDCSASIPTSATTRTDLSSRLRVSGLADDLFLKFMSIHAKRAQCSLFLLVDLICFDSSMVNRQLIGVVKIAGSYIEWEATIAHDLARLNRDWSVVFGDGKDIETISGYSWDNSQADQGAQEILSPESPQCKLKYKERRETSSLLASPLSLMHSQSIEQLYPHNVTNTPLLQLDKDSIRNSILAFVSLHTKLSLVKDAVLKTKYSTAATPLNLMMPYSKLAEFIPEYVSMVKLDQFKKNVAKEIEFLVSNDSGVFVLGSGCYKNESNIEDGQRELRSIEDIEGWLNSVAHVFRKGFKVEAIMSGQK